jgi:excinuclease UvrABC nuclease subunit
MTEQEFEQAAAMRDRFADEAKIQEARAIVNELSSSTDAIGILRLRQHIRSVKIELDGENISGMIEDLEELFSNV